MTARIQRVTLQRETQLQQKIAEVPRQTGLRGRR
jgi:hypothetical protein